MLEIKVKIEAPELVGAINNLSAAMGGQRSVTLESTDSQAVQAPQTGASPVAAPVVTPAAPTAPVMQPQVNTAVPTAPVAAPGVPLAQPPQYTVDQIMAAGASLMDAGKINDLLNLLHSFGVNAVSELKPEQFGAFATAMRELGAKI